MCASNGLQGLWRSSLRGSHRFNLGLSPRTSRRAPARRRRSGVQHRRAAGTCLGCSGERGRLRPPWERGAGGEQAACRPPWLPLSDKKKGRPGSSGQAQRQVAALPATAPAQVVRRGWTPACAGVTRELVERAEVRHPVSTLLSRPQPEVSRDVRAAPFLTISHSSNAACDTVRIDRRRVPRRCRSARLRPPLGAQDRSCSDRWPALVPFVEQEEGRPGILGSSPRTGGRGSGDGACAAGEKGLSPGLCPARFTHRRPGAPRPSRRSLRMIASRAPQGEARLLQHRSRPSW
jgi:hypothetical protein